MRYTEAFIALASSTFESTVQFYEGLIGQQASPRWPEHYAELQLAKGFKLGIFCPQASHKEEFQSPRSGSLSLCLEVEDLDEAITHLTRLGYPPPGPIQQASHGREVYSYDPEGNRLILHQVIRKSGEA
jgi:predicted enzyme related to lactoylglutathione lyase